MLHDDLLWLGRGIVRIPKQTACKGCMARGIHCSLTRARSHHGDLRLVGGRVGCFILSSRVRRSTRPGLNRSRRGGSYRSRLDEILGQIEELQQLGL